MIAFYYIVKGCIYFMKIFNIILGAILIIIFLVSLFRNKNHFIFFKALFLFLALIIGSTINFIIFLLLEYNFLNIDNGLKAGNLFILLGLMIIMSGLILYLYLLLLNWIFPLNSTILSIIEYYIQWTLIYVTIYQVIFENLKKVKYIDVYIKVGNLLNPDVFVVMILPSFISAWIAVILLKKHNNQL